jgi:hypothetical protein
MKNAHLTSTPFRARVIHIVARLLGVLVHIEGWPFGSSRNVRREIMRTGSDSAF